MPSRFDKPISRRAALAALLGGGAAAVSGCASGGMLGYTTAPNYDPEIRTVHVPIFKSRMFQTSPYRGIEFQLTRTVIDTIEARTPMKVISDPGGADTELQGTLVGLIKLEVNRTPYNEARELSMYMFCEIVWHDLRPGHEGKVLTNARRRDPGVLPPDLPFDPTTPPPQIKPDQPQPQIMQATARVIPELGESNTTGVQIVINRMANQIIQAMEQQW
jgi:hypothetical protein